MYCGRCGGNASEQDLICPHCGAPLGRAVAAEPAVAPPVQPPSSAAARNPVILVFGVILAVLVVAGAATAVLAGRRSATPGHPVAGTARAVSIPAASPATKTVTASPTPSPTVDFAALYAREQSGVIRIETLSCSDAGIGTGFLLSPTLIATVEHVIARRGSLNRSIAAQLAV